MDHIDRSAVSNPAELPAGVDPNHVRVDQLISAQARRTPKATAAIFDARSLTYEQLERQCEVAATRLRGLGVARGTLVGIHLDRSLEMLVAVIAVMKAGGAYVPLAPDFPEGRLGLMVADSGLELVISEAKLRGLAPPGNYRSVDIAQLVTTQADGTGTGGDSEVEIDGDADAAGGSDLAYVLYTSGSTGTPKGVAVEHRNVVNFLLGMQRQPGLGPQDRLVAVTTLSFDIAGLELYLPLVTGATVIIASRDDAADGIRLRALIETQQANVLQATPTTWRLLIDAGWQGTRGFKVLCGGEPLPPDLARALLSRCAELWNLYGPTETTIWSTRFRVTDTAAPILIGKAIEHTRVYVLDRAGRPAPIGVPGELYIAGAGVARGYLNRPGLTDERFLADPIAAQPGARMYRTGDLGRYLPDGNLEFRQRLDNQVKIRGFRVELGDIEAAMESHPAVKQAIAKSFEFGPGDTRLVGYLLPHGDAPATTELLDHLRACLPAYMVPQHLATVSGFPLTPNGKVDRKQLPMPEADELLQDVHLDPATPTEQFLVDEFREMLGVERVSADASFFDLGGHSVLAMRLVSRLRQQRHPDITLRMLFDCPTAIALGRAIEALERPGIAGQPEEREAFQF